MKQGQTIGLPPNRPDDKQTLIEERELQNLLLLDQTAFTDSKLQFIEPEKWKNVGVSIVHAVKILKEHGSETAESMAQLHTFLQKFTQKVMAFIHLTDADLIQLRQKTSKDVQLLQRETEEKLRAFKQIQDSSFTELREKYDAQFEVSKKVNEDCWAKIDKIKPTELVLKEVHKAIDSNLGGVRQMIADLGSSVSARFLKLYKEELWEEGIFGPIDGDQFLSMKSYTITQLKRAESDTFRLESESKQSFEQTHAKIQELKDVTLLELYPELRKVERRGEETLTQLGSCKQLIDQLLKSSTGQEADLLALNQILDLKKDQKQQTVRQQTLKIVTEAVSVTHAALLEQITHQTTKTQGEIKALGENLTLVALQASTAQSTTTKGQAPARMTEEQRLKMEKLRRKEGKGSPRQDSKTSKKSEEEKQKKGAKGSGKVLEEPQPIQRSQLTPSKAEPVEIQHKEIYSELSKLISVRLTPIKEEKELAIVNEVLQSQASSQRLETPTVQPNGKEIGKVVVTQIMESHSKIFDETPAYGEVDLNDQDRVQTDQAVYEDKDQSVEFQRYRNDSVIMQSKISSSQLEHMIVVEPETEVNLVNDMEEKLEEPRLQSPPTKVIFSQRHSEAPSVRESLARIPPQIYVPQLIEDQPIQKEKETVMSYLQSETQQQESALQPAPTSDLVSPVLSDKEKSEHSKNSDSESSSSDFSDKELNGLNDLCRGLLSRVKGFKGKLEHLETRQMQQLFVGKKFENKVNETFDRIKIEILEQIVRSQVFIDVLNGHFQHQSPKKSPKRMHLNPSTSEGDQQPKSHWEGSQVMNGPREGLKVVVPKMGANQKSHRTLKIKLAGDVQLNQTQHSDMEVQVRAMLNQATFGANGFKSQDRLQASLVAERGRAEEQYFERQSVPLSTRVESFPQNIFTDSQNKMQKRRPSPVVHQ